MRKIEISYRTIMFTVFFLILLYLVYQLMGVILLVFISVILMSALNPGVDFLQRLKVPRLISILLFYVLILGFISSVVASLITPLVEQTNRLIGATPIILDKLGGLELDPGLIVKEMTSLPTNVFKFALGAFENVIVVFSVMVFTFYLLLQRKDIKKHLTLAFGSDGERKAEIFVDKLEQRLGSWVRGQLFSMTLVGLLTYGGLSLLGIEYALPLAILAGLLEIITNIGPVVSAIPAIIIALATNPTLALGVTALYFVIQQVEAQIITPNVMHQAIGFNPLVTMVALMSGFTLGGIGGAVLALPTVLTGQLIIETIYQNREKMVE